MARESKTAVVAALAGNVALAPLKGVAAAMTGSAAMLAETFHSLADVGNQVLLALGLRLARRPPDARHPFGYGKDAYFSSFVVSVMLFSLGGAVSLWDVEARDPTVVTVVLEDSATLVLTTRKIERAAGRLEEAIVRIRGVASSPRLVMVEPAPRGSRRADAAA